MQTNQLNIEDILLFTSGGLFLIGGVFLILFSQISMRYIKKKIQSEESESISNWDGGMGIIMFGLAMAIIFDKLAAHPMFPNNKYAKKYARKIDYFFALMILILLSISFVGMTVFYFVYVN